MAAHFQANGGIPMDGNEDQGNGSPKQGESAGSGTPPRGNEDGGQGGDWREVALKNFSNPVVFISVLILMSVFYLIGSAIWGLDKGVLAGMAKAEYARGLITYLFAVVTIGTAVVLVVSALTSDESNAHKERFQRGKEILSLLLGVFGTIVGFYFGSEVTGAQARKMVVEVAPIHLSAPAGPAEGSISVDTFLTGGTPPYKVGVGIDGATVDLSDKLDASGWYSKAVSLPDVTAEKAVSIHLVAVDSEGNRGESSAAVVVKPK
jgi:hypothetical protein